MDWYPRNPKDFDLGTLGWSLAERGAYSSLLDAYYLNEGPLPDDDPALASLLRVGLDEWLAVAQKVRTKFKARDGKLHHDRCDDELRKQAHLAEIARKNGRKGGRPNKRKSKDINLEKTQPDTKAGTSWAPTRQDNTEHNPSPSLHSGEGEAPSALTLTGDSEGPKPKAAKGTRLTITDLPQRWDLWAKAQGHPDPQAEWERFRDYWIAQPGKDGVKLEWEATWRNWVRRALQDGKPAIGIKKPAASAAPLPDFDPSIEPWMPKLEQQFDRPTLNSWFRGVRVVDDGDWITLIARTKFQRDYLAQQFTTRLRMVFGDRCDVKHGQPKGKAA